MQKYPTVVLSIVLMMTIHGCRSFTPVVLENNDCSRIASVKIEVVQLQNGDKIYFNSDGGKYYERRTKDTLEQVIIGVDKENTVVKIPVSDVLRVGGIEEQSSSGRTAVLTVLSVLLTEYVLLALLISH